MHSLLKRIKKKLLSVKTLNIATFKKLSHHSDSAIFNIIPIFLNSTEQFIPPHLQICGHNLNQILGFAKKIHVYSNLLCDSGNLIVDTLLVNS